MQVWKKLTKPVKFQKSRFKPKSPKQMRLSQIYISQKQKKL